MLWTGEGQRGHWTRRWPGALALVLFCLAAYLPGLWLIPPVDRDEARFAEASRAMVAADTFDALIVPMNHDKPRLKKPPLIYWLQVASVELFAPQAAENAGQHVPLPSPTGLATRAIWAYRLPSVIGAIAAVLLTWRLGLMLFGGAAGWWAGAILGACLLLQVDARQARVDQVLLAFTVGAQLALWQLWRARRPSLGWLALFWCMVILGVLTKGPVTPLVVIGTVLGIGLITGQIAWVKRLRPLLGIVLLFAVVTPWVLLVGMKVGWERFGDILYVEIIERAFAPQEGHFGPPGTYLLLLPLVLWPGSLALLPAIVRGLRRGLRRPTGERRRWYVPVAGRPAETFLLAWIVPTWIFFEVVATKLPHYVLPMYPAVALLCGRALAGGPRAWRIVTHTRWGRALLWGWYGVAVAIALGTPLTVALLAGLPAARWPALLLTLVVAAALLAWMARSVARGLLRSAQLQCLAVAIIAGIGLFEFTLPYLHSVWISPRLVTAVQTVDPKLERPLAASDYHEESLVFLTAGRVQLISWLELEAWFDEYPNGIAITHDTPELRAGPYVVHAVVTGLNYSAGRSEELAIVSRIAGAASRVP